MVIRSIVIASACAAGAALAFNWGLTSFDSPDPSVEVQEVPERAWRVEVEMEENELPTQTASDQIP
jgi:hypothetical protein